MFLKTIRSICTCTDTHFSLWMFILIIKWSKQLSAVVLEKQVFELDGPTYMNIFFNKHTVHWEFTDLEGRLYALFYIILYKRFENPQIHRGSWNQSPVDTKGWKWKIICNFFLLQEMLVPLNPHKGSLYFQSWEFNNFQEKIWGNFSQFDIDLKRHYICQLHNTNIQYCCGQNCDPPKYIS